MSIDAQKFEQAKQWFLLTTKDFTFASYRYSNHIDIDNFHWERMK